MTAKHENFDTDTFRGACMQELEPLMQQLSDYTRVTSLLEPALFLTYKLRIVRRFIRKTIKLWSRSGRSRRGTRRSSMDMAHRNIRYSDNGGPDADSKHDLLVRSQRHPSLQRAGVPL